VICLDKVAALHERMAQDGYLLLRGLIDRGKVLKARKTVLKFLEEHNALVPDTPLLEGVMGRSPKMMGRKGIQHHPDVLAVLEGDELFRFFERFFSAPAITFKYKWLRAVGNEEYTGAHMDFVYMGRGSGIYTRRGFLWATFRWNKAPSSCVPVPTGWTALHASVKPMERWMSIEIG
jgi:hypothetical protein